MRFYARTWRAGDISFSKSRYKEDWRDLRSQIEHEDGLVNQRLLWMLAFSVFLFAAYGYSLTAEATLVPKVSFFEPIERLNASMRNIKLLRLAICAAGVGVGIASLFGAAAAFFAIKSLVAEFGLPSAKGGYGQPVGPGLASKFGMLSGLAFPCITIGVWLFLGLVQIEWAALSAVICALGVSFAMLIISYDAVANAEGTLSGETEGKRDDQNV